MKAVSPQCLLLALTVLTAPLVEGEGQFIRRGVAYEETGREDGSRKLSFLSDFLSRFGGGSSSSSSSSSSTAADEDGDNDSPRQPSGRLPTRQPTRRLTRPPTRQPSGNPSKGPSPAPSPSPSNLPTQAEPQSQGDDQPTLDGDSPSYWYRKSQYLQLCEADAFIFLSHSYFLKAESNTCIYSDDYPSFMAQLNSTNFPFLSNTKEVCCSNFSCDDEAVSTTAPSKQPSSAPSPSPSNLPTQAETVLDDNDASSAPSYWYRESQ